MYLAVILLNLASLVLFPLFSLTIMRRCLVSSAFSVTLSLSPVSVCPYLLPHLFLPFSVSSVGESGSCQIKASPHALFSSISMRWWALNNVHSQQNLQTCPTGILHDRLMRCVVVVSRSCFLTSEREKPKQREILALPLCGVKGSWRQTL